MFADGLQHFPRAGQSSRESDEVAFGDGDRLTAGRRHGHRAGQEVTLLRFIVVPRKFRDFFFPDLPLPDAQPLEQFSTWFWLDFDLAHAGILADVGLRVQLGTAFSRNHAAESGRADCPEPAVLWFSVDPRRRIHHAIQCVVVSPLDWLICRSGAVGTPRPTQIDDIQLHGSG